MEQSTELYKKRVVSRFDANNQSFVRWFGALLIFVFGFTAFGLVPVIGLNHDEKILPQEISEYEQKIANVQPKFEKLTQEYSQLDEEFQRLTKEKNTVLAEQIQVAEEEQAAISKRDALDQNIKDNDREIQKNRIIINKLEEEIDSGRFENLQDSFRRVRETQLAEAQDLKVRQQVLMEENFRLNDQLDKLKQTIIELEARKNATQEKLNPINKVHQQKEEEFNRVKAQYDSLRDDLEKSRLAIMNLTLKREDVQSRLKNINSPFGPLPVSVSEASMAFPFLIAVGFLICAILYAGLLRLRHEYHKCSLSLNEKPSDSSWHQIIVELPLWFDPLNKQQSNLYNLSAIFIPVFLYLLLITLIFANQVFDLSSNRLDRYVVRFYSILYFLGAIAITIGVLKLRKEWRAYLRTLDRTQ